MMQKILYPERARWPELIRRPAFPFEALEAQIAPVLADVRARGDEAVREYTRRFDGVEIDDPAVPPEALAAAREAVPADLRAAIRLAKRNIETFHAAQVERPVRIETAPGVVCRRKSVAIERVGLYVPGGTAPLFSTVLMLGIPARLAGCREVVLCTPPGPDGAVHPALLFAAHLLGLDRVFRIGGAQAVAAMAYGAGSVPRVDKIFGPGNQYVTVAKQLVTRDGVAIDMPAGPTEVAVVIDETARPDFVAADLLSQAEHGPDSQVVLLSTCLNNVDKVLEAVRRQLESLPRKSIAEQSLAHSKAVVFETMEEVMDFANAYAAEHLILAVENPEALAERVVNAGSVFLGHLTPEAVGDYASGTNHTLPTNGYARAYAGVSVDAFVKKITFQALTEEGLRSIGPAVETMARAEALDGHARAVTIRLAALDAAAPPALPPRVGRVHRQTKETDVHVALDLDGRGPPRRPRRQARHRAVRLPPPHGRRPRAGRARPLGPKLARVGRAAETRAPRRRARRDVLPLLQILLGRGEVQPERQGRGRERAPRDRGRLQSLRPRAPAGRPPRRRPDGRAAEHEGGAVIRIPLSAARTTLRLFRSAYCVKEASTNGSATLRTTHYEIEDSRQ